MPTGSFLCHKLGVRGGFVTGTQQVGPIGAAHALPCPGRPTLEKRPAHLSAAPSAETRSARSTGHEVGVWSEEDRCGLSPEPPAWSDGEISVSQGNTTFPSLGSTGGTPHRGFAEVGLPALLWAAPPSPLVGRSPPQARLRGVISVCGAGHCAHTPPEEIKQICEPRL